MFGGVSSHALELRRQQRLRGRQEDRRLADLRQEFDAQVGREGVRQLHVAAEGAQHQIAQLHGRGGLVQRSALIRKRRAKLDNTRFSSKTTECGKVMSPFARLLMQTLIGRVLQMAVKPWVWPGSTSAAVGL